MSRTAIVLSIVARLKWRGTVRHNGLGELPEFQSLIEQVRARNAELRTHVRENMPELSDPEWVATSSAG